MGHKGIREERLCALFDKSKCFIPLERGDVSSIDTTLSFTVNEYTRTKTNFPILTYNDNNDYMALTYDMCETGSLINMTINGEIMPTMFHTGATASFIDENHELVRKLEIKKLSKERQLLMFDGRPSASGSIKYYIEADIQFHAAYPLIKADLIITRLNGADVVLGTSFLSKQGIALDFGKGQIRLPEVRVKPEVQEEDSLRATFQKKQISKSIATGPNAIRVKSPRYTYVSSDEQAHALCANINSPEYEEQSSPFHSSGEERPSLLSEDESSEDEVVIMDPGMDYPAAMDARWAPQINRPSAAAELYMDDIVRDSMDIAGHSVLRDEAMEYSKDKSESNWSHGERPLAEESLNAVDRSLRLAAVMSEDIPDESGLLEKDNIELTEDEEILEIVPSEYHEFMEVFRKTEGADVLPPHRPYDHHIVLQEGSKLTVAPLYQLDATKIDFMRSYIAKERLSGRIRPSSSPYGSPCFLVPKPGGLWRLVVDYRGLNRDTVKDAYPLPLISQIFGTLGKSRYFAKFDLTSAYQRVRMTEGEEPLTAFRIH